MDQNRLYSLVSIDLQNNNFGNVPSEITNQENPILDLRNWFKDLVQSNEPSYEVKLILAGNGRVGKTSILQRFFENRFDPHQESTHGIQLYRKVFSVRKDNREKIPLLINAWDFGGQEIYHATHRLFMQSRALYLVVWDEETEQQKKAIEKIEGQRVEFDNYILPYWLHKARALSLNSPLLVIKNKIDIQKKKTKLPPNATVLEGEFNITDFASCATSKEKHFKKLRNEILDQLKEMPEVGMRMPTKWLLIKKELLKWKVQGKRTIAFDEFVNLCKKKSLSSGSVDTLIRFLHNTGTLFYQRETFKDKIILDQEWALEGIYLLFKRNWIFDMLLKTKGEASLLGLGGVWAKYDLEERKVILSMMLSCEICFEVSRDKDNVNILIPYYLPEEASSIITDHWAAAAEGEMALQYSYPFFHSAFMIRFISKAGRLTEHPGHMWKKGIWITHKGTEALIQAFPRDHYISIRVRGKDAQDLLKRIHEAFKEIHYDSKKVTRKVGFSENSLTDYENVKAWQEGMELIDGRKKKLDINKFKFFKSLFDPEDEQKELKRLADIIPPPVSITKEEVFIDWDRSVVKLVTKKLNQLVQSGEVKIALDRCLDITKEGEEFKQDLIHLNSQFNNLKRKEILNTIDPKDAQRTNNQITASFQALLGYLDFDSLDETKTREYLATK